MSIIAPNTPGSSTAHAARSLPLGDSFHLFDTTLRDGAQRQGISYSVADKILVAGLLDELGVGIDAMQMISKRRAASAFIY